jgi:putative acetyltransferase
MISSSLSRIFTEASITARPFFERAGFQLITQQTVEHNGVSFVNCRMEKFL